MFGAGGVVEDHDESAAGEQGAELGALFVDFVGDVFDGDAEGAEESAECVGGG